MSTVLFQKLVDAPSFGEGSPTTRVLLEAKADIGNMGFELAEAVRTYVGIQGFASYQDVCLWLSELIDWKKGGEGAVSKTLAQTLLDALILSGTFGLGRSFGEKVLLQLPKRSISIPGAGRLLLTGTSHSGLEALTEGGIFAKDLAFEDPLPFAEGIGLPEYTEEVRNALRDLIALASQGLQLEDLLPGWQQCIVVFTCSLNTDDGLWRMSVHQAAALLEWGGVISSGSLEDSVDPDQALVASLPVTHRSTVIAGPGSGKTEVVSQRIAHLLGDGVMPSRIWLLSFTRIAVEALRHRIESVVTSETAIGSLQVATFDSFAGQLLEAGLPQDAARPVGFEAAIKAAIELLKDPPPQLNAHFSRLCHVVIDESQDVVGLRLVLIRRFLELLPESCGVTILGDPAQAIYGWSSSSREVLPSLLEDADGFVQLTLRTDHRTRSDTLRDFFKDGRQIVIATDLLPVDRYLAIRESIEASSEAAVRGLGDPALPTDLETMVLFRSRRALLAETYRQLKSGRNFRLRSVAHGKLIRPWIGAMLAGIPAEGNMSREEFEQQLPDILPLVETLEISRNEDGGEVLVGKELVTSLWTKLLEVSDSPSHRLNLSLLHRRLSRGGLAPDMFRVLLGGRGPILGTIHGAKGLEAENVVLMLPRFNVEPDDGSKAHLSRGLDYDEEARVLFVGASRARQRLYIGSQRVAKLRPIDKNRSWRGYPTNFSVEIGIEGDVEPVGLETRLEKELLSAAAKAMIGPGECPKPRLGIAVRNESDGVWLIYRADMVGAPVEPALGQFSGQLIKAICDISDVVETELPHQITGFYLSGAATCAWAQDETGRRGFAVIPVVCGLGIVTMEPSL